MEGKETSENVTLPLSASVSDRGVGQHPPHWVRLIGDLRISMQVSALEHYLQDVASNSRWMRLLCSSLIGLGKDRLEVLLNSVSKECTALLFSSASDEDVGQIFRILNSSNQSPADHSSSINTDGQGCPCASILSILNLDYEEDPEECVPALLVERGDDLESEFFLKQVQDIMQACSDCEEPLPCCVVTVKDSVGDWMRKCVKGEKKLSMDRAGELFPKEFPGFCRWLEARKDGNTQEDLEEVEALMTNQEDDKEESCKLEYEGTELKCLGISVGAKQRLETFHQRTLLMSCTKYSEFSLLRSTSLTSNPRSRKVFCSWVGLSATTNSVVVTFLGYILWERIETLMHVCKRIRELIVERKREEGLDANKADLYNQLAYRYGEIRSAIDIIDYHIPPLVVKPKPKPKSKANPPSRGTKRKHSKQQ